MSEYLQSELPVIELFKNLGCKYFDAKGEMYEVVLEPKQFHNNQDTSKFITSPSFLNPETLH